MMKFNNRALTYQGLFMLVAFLLSSFGVGHAQFNPNVCYLNGETLLDGESLEVYQTDQVPFGSSCISVKEIFTCNQGVLNGINAASDPDDYDFTECRTLDPMECSLGPVYGQQTVIAHGELATGYKEESLDPGIACDSIGPSGNMGVLSCNNGTLIASSRWIVNPADYQYPTCVTRETDDCIFNGEVIQHGFSTTGYLVPHPTIGQQCTHEIRTCLDGDLSGSYQFAECTTTDAHCGNATGQAYTQTPMHNLCSEGYLLGSVGVNTSGAVWEWNCGGFGLNTVTCRADSINIATGVAQCTSFPGYMQYLSESGNNLCTLPSYITGDIAHGYATGFTTWSTGRSRYCNYNNSLVGPCSALNDVIPTGTITYNPDDDTEGNVTATLGNINVPSATVINGSGSLTHVFTSNGSYTFFLNLDGKIGSVQAVVDRISERQDIFREMLINYEENLCDQFRFDMQDINGSRYKVDILTMKNLCIMRGYRFSSKRLFLPNKELTIGEGIVVLRKMAEKLGDYDYYTDDSSRYKYFGINTSHALYEYIRWAEDVDIMKYLRHTKKENMIAINFNSPITKKEFRNMMNHVLYIHNFREPINDRLFDEIDFQFTNTVARGEAAWILRRIIEGYEHMPIGNDYRLLYLIYLKIKDENVDDQIEIMTKINNVIARMPLSTLNAYGLTKWRLITDIQGVTRNQFPERLEKVTATIDMVMEQLWYEDQPDFVIDLKNIEDVLDDDYHDLER